MNILVIGNGFDLAHDLPTKYGDFMKFVKVIRQLFGDKVFDFLNIIDEADISDQIKAILKEEIGNTKIPCLDKKWELWLAKNVWIDFFLQSNTYQKDNWIDFESEISRVIQVLDIAYKEISKSDLFDKIDSRAFNKIEKIRPKFVLRIFYYLREHYILRLVKKCIKSIIRYIRTMEQPPNLRDVKRILEILKIEQKLSELIHNKKVSKCYEDDFCRMIVGELNADYEKDLNDLIAAFEKYLYEYVSKIKIENILVDIKNVDFNKVISFNYTETCEKVYAKQLGVEYDYIHGKAYNGTKDNNMVLGIDEYLLDDRRDKDIEFIAFKKYYQRIYKGTGCNYKNWIDKVRESAKLTEKRLRKEFPIQIPFKMFKNKHHVYIFGHSLDITDKDVLRELILNDNVYTTIYYPDKKELGRKIANLVKVIGQDELIRRTGGSTKTIEFVPQRSMVGGESK